MPLESVSRDLERLSQEALVADQPRAGRDDQQRPGGARSARPTTAQRQAVRAELAHAMADFVDTASDPAAGTEPQADRSPRCRSPPAPRAASPAPSASTGLEDDAEMREIFLEEAREVMQNAHAALAALADAPTTSAS